MPPDFRRLHSAPWAEEGSHIGAVDFRVGGRIFAMLAAVAQGYGNLILTPALQADFVSELPNVFLPIPNGWGRNGNTHVRLVNATEQVLAGALHTAWKARVEKNKNPNTRAKAGPKSKKKSAR